MSETANIEGFEAWVAELKAAFVKHSDMTADEAARMVDGAGMECWRQFYDENITPDKAALSEISYWEDDGEDGTEKGITP